MNHIRILTALIAFWLAVTVRAEPPKPAAGDDPLPPGVLARLGSSRFTHFAPLDHIAFTADGKTVVFVGRDSVVGRWDMADGKELGRVALQRGGPRSDLLAPDGTVVAHNRITQGVSVVDAVTGKVRFSVPKRGPSQAVMGWGKRGQTLLVGTAGDVLTFDVTTGRELVKWKMNPGVQAMAVAGSPDGTRVAALTDAGNVILFDATTGKELQSFARSGAARRGRLVVETLVFSPDGKKLIDCSSARTDVWDVVSGKRLPPFAAKEDRTTSGTAAWSPDGRFLAAAGTDSTVRLVDVDTGKVVKTISSTIPVRVLRFSPDSRLLAGLGNSPCPELWDVATGKSLAAKTGHRGAVMCLAFSAGGRVVTGGADSQLMEWDWKTGRLVSSFGQRGGPIRSLAVGGPGIVYSQGAQLKGWKLGTKVATPLAWEQPEGMDGVVSADSRVFACWDDAGKVQCFEAATGKKLAAIQVGEDADVLIHLSPDGRFLGLRTFADDGSFVRVWRTADGRLLRTLTWPEEYTQAAAFGPNGRTVATFNNADRVRVTELATGADFVVPMKAGRASAVTFSPNSRILFIGCQNGEVYAYDLIAGELSGPHAGHKAMVDALAVSADGITLVTGSTDTTALVWDAAALRPRLAAATPPRPGDLEQWWKDLVAPGGDKVRAALAGLSGSPKDALPFLKEHLKPPPLPPRDRIAGWIRDLDSPRFAAREKASRSLAALGEDATDFLNDALAKATTGEGRRRIELLLRETESHLSAPNLQLLRGLDLLELIGGEEARTVLDGLVKTAEESWLKREAKATLARFSVTGKK